MAHFFCDFTVFKPRVDLFIFIAALIQSFYSFQLIEI